MEEREIFIKALQVDNPDARNDYLTKACGNNVALRRGIEDLLNEHDNLNSFMDPPNSPAIATIDMPSITETVGSIIGPYKLMEQIGEGGMGVVYVAQQEKPVKRRVALKIIKPGMDTKQVIARFEAERQALALMNHPNIAKVLDVGATETGQPYFCMELVRGLPITEYCDKKTLNTRKRLELFIKVCRAVQHAHQKGVIHRDLKPTNILVTIMEDGPVPKVIDFGVAKATNQQLTEQTLYTAHSQMIGTPLYMSPEQAEMTGFDIDTRSDVSSLGVLLYELLAGSTPFDKQTLKEAGFDEMRRIIREEEPPRPSDRISTLHAEALSTVSAQHNIDAHRFSRQIQGELDWIVMRALDKDRTRRYESASSFAADIERYLTDQPVEACPPSAAYRLRKLARRNKGFITTISLVVLALLIGTAVSLWQAKEANDARDLANHRLLNETEARKDASKQRKLAESNLNESETQRERAESNLQLAMDALNAVFLQSVGQDRVFDGGNRIDSQRELSDKEKKLLQTGLDFYSQIANQNESNIVATYGTAKAFLEIGRLHASLKEAQKAETALSEAITRLIKLTESSPDNAHYYKQLNNAYFAKANLRRSSPQFQDTLANAHTAIDKAIEIKPKDATMYYQRARLIQQPNEIANALADFEKAVEFDPDNAGLQHRVSLRLRFLNSKNPIEALEFAKKAVELAPQVATYHSTLGHMYWVTLHDRKLALNALDRAIELDPNLVRAYIDRHWIYSSFDPLRGLEEINKALQIDPEHAQALRYRGEIYEKFGRFEEALIDFNKSQRFDPTNREPYNNRGLLYLKLHQYEAALSDFNKTVELAPNFVPAYRNRGLTHFRLGKYDNALADIARAIELDPHESNILWCIPQADVAACPDKTFLDRMLKLADKAVNQADKPYNRLARAGLLEALGRHEQTLPDIQKVIDHRSDRALFCNNAAWFFAKIPGRTKLIQGAVILAQKAVELKPEQGAYRNTLGVAHYRAGNWQAAIDALQKSDQLYEGGFHSYNGFFLSMAHWQLGHKDEAQQHYQKSIDWMKKNKPDDEDLIQFRAEAEELLDISTEAQKPENQEENGITNHPSRDA